MAIEKKLLIIFPTNIGDAVMALPVLDRLHARYPAAAIDAFVSPRTFDFMERHVFLKEAIIFDKHWPLRRKAALAISRRGQYDLVIDLKNTFFPLALGARRFTPVVRRRSEGRAVDDYLALAHPFIASAAAPGGFKLSEGERERWDRSVPASGAIFLACASRSSLKQYDPTMVADLARRLAQIRPVVILGSREDVDYYGGLNGNNITNLAGATGFADIFYLLKRYAAALVCVDSAIMHAASYFQVPVVALFGPSDPRRYGPWSACSLVLRDRNLSCVPCKAAQCDRHVCMSIPGEEIVAAVNRLING